MTLLQAAQMTLKNHYNAKIKNFRKKLVYSILFRRSKINFFALLCLFNYKTLLIQNKRYLLYMLFIDNVSCE